MTHVSNEITIFNAMELSTSRVEAHCAAVSSMLSNNAPFNKPKTVEELLMNSQNSFFAEYGGDLVGHVALNSLGWQLVEAGLAHGADSSMAHTKAEHFAVQSLVAHPGYRGFGLGVALVAVTAQESVNRVARQPLTNANLETGPRIGILSAVVNPNSKSAFSKNKLHKDLANAATLEPYATSHPAEKLHSEGKSLVSRFLIVS
jgi:GNAT superfamily N-acetyltransferase